MSAKVDLLELRLVYNKFDPVVEQLLELLFWIDFRPGSDLGYGRTARRRLVRSSLCYTRDGKAALERERLFVFLIAGKWLLIFCFRLETVVGR